MLTNTIEKLPKNSLDKLNQNFLDTALAYEFNANWRLVAKKCGNNTFGIIKKTLQKVSTYSEEQMEVMIDTFISEYMKTKEKQTTKKCPNCGNENLLLIRTYNEKICTDCDTIIPWYLEDGQEPLH